MCSCHSYSGLVSGLGSALGMNRTGYGQAEFSLYNRIHKKVTLLQSLGSEVTKTYIQIGPGIPFRKSFPSVVSVINLFSCWPSCAIAYL